jgi:hypothetical protein
MGFIERRTWSDMAGPGLRLAFALVLILILLLLMEAPR